VVDFKIFAMRRIVILIKRNWIFHYYFLLLKFNVKFSNNTWKNVYTAHKWSLTSYNYVQLKYMGKHAYINSSISNTKNNCISKDFWWMHWLVFW
jgi:hypothetical protein